MSVPIVPWSSRATLAVLLIVGGGCAQPESILQPERPAPPSLARGGDFDSHANWTFFDTLSDGTTPTSLYGDGRGEYFGETCGVRGKIFSGSGDGVFQPEFASSSPNSTSCARRMRVKFADYAGGSEITFNPFANVPDISDNPALQIAAGPWAPAQLMPWSTSSVAMPCGTSGVELRFITAEGSGVRVRRLSDQGGARVWEVESTGDHQARCLAPSKGKLTPFGRHYLPFHAVIVEVRAPSGGW